MFDPRPLCCNSLTTTVGGTKDTNIVDSESPYRGTNQPQPLQLISPVEQAILDLTKLVGNFVEAQRTINAQLSQKIDTMENNVNKRIDRLQSEME